MGLTQKYGIKYPFTAENTDNLIFDLNKDYTEAVKSQVLHVIFTPKGQKLRDPEFGTDLMRYIFSPRDGETFDAVRKEIISQVSKYVSGVELRDISVYKDEENDNGIAVIVKYGVKKGNKTEVTTVAVKL